MTLEEKVRVRAREGALLCVEKQRRCESAYTTKSEKRKTLAKNEKREKRARKNIGKFKISKRRFTPPW